MPDARETFRFGEFELDVAAYELRRSGRPIRLERHPMDLLILLVTRRTELVQRADIIERLWGKDVFVDVETGVHTAMRKLRQALRDSAEAPTFVETVPGRGYRFIAPVEVVKTRLDAPAVPSEGTPIASPIPARKSIGRVGSLLGPLALIVLIGVVAWMQLAGGRPESRIALAVLPFQNIGNDPEREYVADGLTEETSASLALSAAIAEHIRLRLSPQQLDALARRQTKSVEAYDLYLRGRNYANQRTPLTTQRAIEYYQQATAIDPNYALAWSGIADALSSSPINGDAAPLDIAPRAREAAAQAVRADPSLADAQFSLAYVRWTLDWDWTGAEAAFRKAITLGPEKAWPHSGTSRRTRWHLSAPAWGTTKRPSTGSSAPTPRGTFT